MAEIPQGLSWVERDDDFALHRRDGDKVTTIAMSAEEAIGLRQMLTDWASALKQRLPAQSGGAQPVFAFQAQEVSADADAMHANVLLQWTTGAEGSALSIAADDARELSAQIEKALRLIDQRQTRQ